MPEKLQKALEEDGAVNVPGWFVKLVTGSIVLAAPFFCWVTVTLLSLQFQVSSLATMPERQLSNHNLIVRTESTIAVLTERLAKAEILISKIENEQSRRTGNVYAIEAIKDDLKLIKGDVDKIRQSLFPSDK